MPAKRSSALIVAVAFLVVLAVPGSAAAQRTRLCVGGGHGCFKTLQAAVDAAHDGSTIRIAPGTYRGRSDRGRSVATRRLGRAPDRDPRRWPVLTLGGYDHSPTSP